MSREQGAARRPAEPVSPSQDAMPADLTGRAARFAADWAPTAARMLLGLVLGWFGYHELVQPALWTGYVPLLSAASSVAVILVLAHGGCCWCWPSLSPRESRSEPRPPLPRCCWKS